LLGAAGISFGESIPGTSRTVDSIGDGDGRGSDRDEPCDEVVATESIEEFDSTFFKPCFFVLPIFAESWVFFDKESVYEDLVTQFKLLKSINWRNFN
jgi:hypothetical protein